SLMFLAEGGEWDAATKTYLRPIDRVYNQSDDSWTTIYAESPFKSIPDSFWWAIITASTVGYGDHFPVSPTGKVVAVLNILFSLVILALPVGVIGGTFSQVWSEFDEEKRKSQIDKKRQMQFITSAIQKLDPSTMTRLMLIELWHEHPELDPDIARPEASRFLGEVAIKLDLPRDQSITRQMTLRVEGNSELVERNVTGKITIRYTWTPQRNNDKERRQPHCPGEKEQSKTFNLEGQLEVTLIEASGLLNLDWSKRNGASHPYCMVLCYPVSPGDDILKPVVWRAPTKYKTPNPKWNASHTFNFCWKNVSLSYLE
ncbi:unnamed protein product, partial [Polarella glacialis]